MLNINPLSHDPDLSKLSCQLLSIWHNRIDWLLHRRRSFFWQLVQFIDTVVRKALNRFLRLTGLPGSTWLTQPTGCSTGKNPTNWLHHMKKTQPTGLWLVGLGGKQCHWGAAQMGPKCKISTPPRKFSNPPNWFAITGQPHPTGLRSQGKPNQSVSNFGKILKTNCVGKRGVQCLIRTRRHSRSKDTTRQSPVPAPVGGIKPAPPGFLTMLLLAN